MIDSLDALRRLYPDASPRSRAKQMDRLNATMRRFIEHSPFCVLASVGASGALADASPRGGRSGFVCIEDEQTLLLPDATGNNRLDTLENLIQDSRAGLLFLVPGVNEVLRINGRVELRDEPEYTQRFTGEGITAPPRLVLRVVIQEAYLHCPKALMRARLWAPVGDPSESKFPTMNAMLRAQLGAKIVSESDEEAAARYASQLAAEGFDGQHIER